MTTVDVVPRRAWVQHLMGMPVSVHLRGTGAVGARAEEAVASVFEHLRHVDAVFSTYRPDSDVSRLNRGEVTVAGCHPSVADVVDLCAEARAQTGGAFDARLPAPGGGTWFEPSGLVKGWAVEDASRALAEVDDADFCLNAGGDVVVGTATADLLPWRVGIEDPHDVGRVVAVVEAYGGGVATSGTARRGLHIVDPRSGLRAATVRSATVVGPSLMWADVYATALVVMGDEGLSWLAGIEDYETLMVSEDGTVATSTGWPAPAGSPGSGQV